MTRYWRRSAAALRGVACADGIGRRAVSFFLAACVLYAADAARAQGFMVKPMKLEVSARPGHAVQVPLEIRNTDGEGIRALDLRLAELNQSDEGSWGLIEPEAGDSAPIASSALHWITLDKGRMEIPALGAVNVAVTIDVPPSAQGYYFAALIAETPIPEGQNALSIRVRFLIPVIVEIQDRPVRKRIDLEDASMIYEPGGEARPRATTAVLRVANKGLSLSRLQGRMTLEAKAGDKWLKVTRLDLPERSIMPGMTLQLGQDVGRMLPTGAYRLTGEVYVDGLRLPPLARELEFVGDPGAASLHLDTSLIVNPETVDLDIVPGASRTASVQIENPGENAVVVRAGALPPAEMAGFAMGDLNGNDLSAARWIQFQPPQFELPPHGKRTVQIVSRVPRDGVDFPHYYADIVFEVSYSDGQSAGRTRALAHLRHKGRDTVPAGLVDQLTLAESSKPLNFIVQTRFINSGNVHVQPRPSVFLQNKSGRKVREQLLEGTSGTVLPLARRNYSAELSFEDLDPGLYTLQASVEFDKGRQAVMKYTVKIENVETAGDGGAPRKSVRASIVDPVEGAAPAPSNALSVNANAAPTEVSR